MDLRCSDSTPCHDQKANSVSTPSSEPLRPGDLISDQAGGNSASKSKPTVLAGHAPSSVPAELEPQACGVAGLNSESSGGSGNCDASTGESLLGDREVSQQIGTQLKLLPMNDQIRELQTIIRDKTASRGDFMFSADRLIRLVVEEGLNQLPYKECMVTTPTGYKYEGVKFEKGNCGVSIMRSGEAMEQGLRDCCRSIRIGKILIQSDEETQRAKVYYAKFPPDIYRRKVLLMYPILSTGNTVIEAVKVLIEHGVQPSVIILLSLFSTPHGECSMTGHGLGAKSIIQEFPEITILTTEVHPVAPTHFGQKYFGTD
ncbi:uracil phosphoribosyltransferase homolog isoform X1 [Ursus maritimus]|uniref:Uracil phosphoribosyltransferase homolog n=2 Tax=Ursus TaxID=9639 RepID=A0A384D2I2_URSMA|nr:uracil phosphoribosyltransferase homolog isoform X1 [Ursus maritimus]XP_026342979.1 uracil phosphoribosyltransferase homolog isoform X3 [Ursus arctos]XP_044235742.1 uracil phosphoribosyltransferase homolog isoform X3 [Ursus arctos]XP_044235744.1 uracil phosphoribosyltransferase homolog isoform X3 [Ursus arctos]